MSKRARQAPQETKIKRKLLNSKASSRVVRSVDRVQFHFEESSFLYDGSQLKHLFAYERFGILGTSMVAWTGACKVGTDKMIDGEDKFSNSEIRGDSMLHFVGEFFHKDIFY